jgi:hypothetical protein
VENNWDKKKSARCAHPAFCFLLLRARLHRRQREHYQFIRVNHGGGILIVHMNQKCAAPGGNVAFSHINQ